VRLRNVLGRIKGKFVLSYNDSPKIRELYQNYQIIAAERFDNLTAKAGGKVYKEIMIKNY